MLRGDAPIRGLRLPNSLLGGCPSRCGRCRPPICRVVAVGTEGDPRQRLAVPIRLGGPGIIGQGMEILRVAAVTIVHSVEANVRDKTVGLRPAWFRYLDLLTGVAQSALDPFEYLHIAGKYPFAGIQVPAGK